MSIERLLKPRSIAVFGGSQAQEVIRQSDLMGYNGEIWPVHPKKTEIMGRTVYRSVADLPASPDAAYVGVNRNLTIDIVRDLAARDAGGAICYATGFMESGEEGSQLQEQLLQASGDMPLIGPNCYGILNYLDGAMLWPDQQGGRRVDEGVAIISMSSNVGFSLTMQRRGLPIAYMLSLGNKLKFDLHDAIHTFAREEKVTAIGLYLETMPDLKAFEEAVAIRPDQGHVTRGLQKPLFEFATLLAHLGKAGGIADRPARIPRSQISDDVDGEVAINTHVRSIGASRQILHRAVDRAPQDLRLLGMDRPDLPFVSHTIALTNHLLGLRTAKNGNVAWFQKTLK